MAADRCAQREAKTTPGTAVYRRRQPERSAVYHVVRDHLETRLAGCRHADEEGFPVAAHIEQDFRKYLEGGILAHGFDRVLLIKGEDMRLLQYTAYGGDGRTPG